MTKKYDKKRKNAALKKVLPAVVFILSATTSFVLLVSIQHYAWLKITTGAVIPFLAVLYAAYILRPKSISSRLGIILYALIAAIIAATVAAILLYFLLITAIGVTGL